MNKAILFDEPGAVRSRLAELGIPDPELLREAISEGELTRASFHGNVPAMAVGCAGWGVTVGAARNRLAPHGWIPSSEGRLETTFNPLTLVAIAVTTGDWATGKADATPRTKHQKGVATVAAIDRNNQQLSLLSTLSPDSPYFVPASAPHEGEEDVSPGVMLWELLKYRDGDELRSELSLPSGYGIDGVVHSWRERIILKPIDLDGGGLKVATQPIEPTPDLDVRVTRRQVR